MNNVKLPDGVQIKDPEKALQAILNICRDVAISGKAGATNLAAVRCSVDGLTLGHFYELWDALGEDVCKAIEDIREQKFNG